MNVEAANRFVAIFSVVRYPLQVKLCFCPWACEVIMPEAQRPACLYSSCRRGIVRIKGNRSSIPPRPRRKVVPLPKYNETTDEVITPLREYGRDHRDIISSHI